MPYKEKAKLDANLAKNKEQRKQYQHEWYLKNREAMKIRARNRVRLIRSWYWELKTTLSCSCGESHPGCLSFHHDDPNKKERSISFMVSRGWSKERIMKEIEKCTPMCENCHRKLHWDLKYGPIE
jgi:hypothetical protein